MVTHITLFGVMSVLWTFVVITLSDPATATDKKWSPMENACLCKEFRCNGGTFCLHAERVCNGFTDCPGGEDEQVNVLKGKCHRKKATCGSDEFKCKFGDCIKLTAVCDGKIDCWGAVDEAIDFCTWLYSDDSSNTTNPLH